MAKKREAAGGGQQDVKTVVYVGPTIPKVAKNGTAYVNGLVPKLQETMEKNPIFLQLVIPVDKLAAARKEINTPGSAANLLFKEAEKVVKGGL